MNTRMCTTKFHSPTDHKGSRVSATHMTTGRRITRAWDDSHDVLWNHRRVAAELLAAEGLGAALSFDESPSRLVWASTRDDSGYVFAAVSPELFRDINHD
jgi:hypothetical protein